MTEYDKYDSPTELLADTSLTQDKKIELLEAWCADEEALIRASDEGLDGGERPDLRHIQLALETAREG